MRLFIFVSLLFALFFSCRKDEEVTTDQSARLSFSTDSVLFDTIFTSVGSVTRKVKIFNNNPKAVIISQIKLAGGNSSAFQVNINGKSSGISNNIMLAGKDSMYIFVKATINPTASSLPFIVADSILFTTNGNLQKIQLAAYGQNARFLNNQKITQNTIWDKTLPYVIYNAVTVNKDVKLQINPGCRIYFHKNGKLVVSGTLEANGLASDSITFASDRRERIYESEPGQWTGIQFTGSSRDNVIKNATIKNAVIGLQVDSASINSNPKLIVANSIIKNMQVSGLAALGSNCSLYGNLIFNCGHYLIYGIGGGNFDIKQNTFANYNFNFSRETPAVFLSDNKQGSTRNLSVNLTNNIIWGSLDDELVFNQNGSNNINLTFSTNLIKSRVSAYAISGNILNIDPQFSNARTEQYRLLQSSPAINKGTNLSGDPYYNLYLSKDLTGKSRIFPSELGCYEF